MLVEGIANTKLVFGDSRWDGADPWLHPIGTPLIATNITITLVLSIIYEQRERPGLQVESYHARAGRLLVLNLEHQPF